MSRLRVALIGFGNVAQNGHLPGWQQHPDIEITGVVDADPARRREAGSLLSGVQVFEELDQLFENQNLDLVDIATPPTLHSTAIIAAARAKCQILCEKPLTTSVDEYREIERSVADNRVVLYPVHNWKYAPAFRRVRKVLCGGRLGRLRRISFRTLRNGCAAGTGNWRMNPTLAGGGILVDHGWHVFYLMMALCGEKPLSISAELMKDRYQEAEVEDTASCRIRFPSVEGEVYLSWAADHRETSWSLSFEKGELRVVDAQLTIEQGAEVRRETLGQSLSEGSHHPEWFPPVIDDFLKEVREPEYRGRGQQEAETCLKLTRAAYKAAQCHPLIVEL